MDELGNDKLDEGGTVKMVTMNGISIELHAPIVADRLERAGVRLAHLVTTSRASRAISAAGGSCREDAANAPSGVLAR